MQRAAGRLIIVSATLVALTGFAALAGPATASPVASNANFVAHVLNGRGHYMHRGSNGEADVNVCSDLVPAGDAHCNAYLRTDAIGEAPGASDFGLGDGGAYDPAYLQSAYDAPSTTNGVGQTVAVVDANDDPTAESNLATYRAYYNLPACTTANGCFRKVDQKGGTSYPAPDAGWSAEISLDLDMVSAICPNCHILLVEAKDTDTDNLGIAVNEAVALGANVVSNSYGVSESYMGPGDEAALDTAYYNHPGVAIVASAGDSGYGVQYPAASPDVIAVGGTSLIQATNTGTRSATETVWDGTGSGCSAYEAKPAWQTDTTCSRRMVTDVSAEADPSTGVWVFEPGGWDILGGTSASAPIIGAMYALADNAPSHAQLSSYPYGHPTLLNDVTTGNNGTCGGTYFCTAGTGYDGPTGLGTPSSANPFSTSGLVPPPVPGFVMSAAALTAPLTPGSSVNRVVTITPLNGITGSANLSVTTSPSAGLSTSIAPHAIVFGSTASTATLGLVAHKGGTYTVTILAAEGTLSHTTTVKVSVHDFSLRVSPATRSVVRGTKYRFTVTLTPAGSFTGPVKLSVSGLRAHDKIVYAHNPAPASGSETVAITPWKKDARGTLALHFTGTHGSLRHSVAVKLQLR